MDYLKCWLNDLFDVIEDSEQSENHIELLKSAEGNAQSNQSMLEN